MSGSKQSTPPQASIVETMQGVEGYEPGGICPPQLGQIVRVQLSAMTMSGTKHSVDLLMESETAVAIAKTILLVAAELGVPVR